MIDPQSMSTGVEHPLVSVVMGVYNGEKVLKPSIASILNQQDVAFEFIVVNDGSTDGTGEILADYRRRDTRLRVIDQENQGLTRALIRGCREAQGRYIVRQDGDDLSVPGRLAVLAGFMEQQQEVVLAFSWIRCVAPDGEVMHLLRSTATIDELTRKLREEMSGIPAHGSVILCRDAYEQAGGYRPEFYYAQDCDLWLRMAPLGKVGCVPGYLYDLCYSMESISASRRELQSQFCELAQGCYQARQKGVSETDLLVRAAELRQQALDSREATPSRRNRAITNLLIAAGLEVQGNSRALHYYLTALRSWPLSPKVWKGVAVHLLKRWLRSGSRRMDTGL